MLRQIGGIIATLFISIASGYGTGVLASSLKDDSTEFSKRESPKVLVRQPSTSNLFHEPSTTTVEVSDHDHR
jgi:hypothetical protein